MHRLSESEAFIQRRFLQFPGQDQFNSISAEQHQVLTTVANPRKLEFNFHFKRRKNFFRSVISNPISFWTFAHVYEGGQCAVHIFTGSHSLDPVDLGSGGPLRAYGLGSPCCTRASLCGAIGQKALGELLRRAGGILCLVVLPGQYYLHW